MVNHYPNTVYDYMVNGPMCMYQYYSFLIPNMVTDPLSFKVDEFKSISKFKVFNTNNLWTKFSAIDRLVTNGGIKMDVIVNKKVRLHIEYLCSLVYYCVAHLIVHF